MEAQQKKTLSRLIQCFSLFLVLRVVEELVIIPHFRDTKGLVACIGGFAILLFYIRYINKPLEEIGMIFSTHKIRKGLLLALLLNAVSAVIVYTVEYNRFAAMEGHTKLVLFYDKINNAYSIAGLGGFLAATGFALLVAIIHALFYEMTFRGLLITLGSRSLSFAGINAIQAGLYTFWYLLPVLRILIYYSNVYPLPRILTLFIVTLIYELLTAVKLGLLRFSTGSIWVCIFDHIGFAFIIDMIHIQYTTADMTVQLDSGYYGRIIGYQVISLAIAVIYYFRRRKKINEMRLERRVEKNA